MTDLTHEHVRFVGSAGRLAGILSYGAAPASSAAALIAGPHPYMGGTMHHPLLESLATALARAGMPTLRFDYGGAGQSEGSPVDVAASLSQFWQSGHAPEDADRLADAAAALRFVDSLQMQRLVVCGYSFGCYAALRALGARQERGATIIALVLISPTLARHDFASAWPAERRLACAVLVIHSDNDFLTPLAEARRWIGTRSPEPELVVIGGADHFFRGVESAVADRCASWAAARLRCAAVCGGGRHASADEALLQRGAYA